MIGFLTAGKDGKSEIAVQYLHTELKGGDATALSHQLFTVLDARLPAKLAKLSDVPEGSRENPLKINEEVVGTVERVGGALDIIVERVEQPAGPPIWQFSAWTLKSIPDVYDEVSGGWGNTGVGQLLNSTRLRRARHFEWLAVLLCLPLFYFFTVLLNTLLTPLIRRVWRRAFPESDFIRKVLPAPIRLLIVALALRWFLASVSLSLFVRQAGATAANLILLAGLAWLLIQLNGEVERYRAPSPPEPELGRRHRAGAPRAPVRRHRGRLPRAPRHPAALRHRPDAGPGRPRRRRHRDRAGRPEDAGERHRRRVADRSIRPCASATR